MNAPSLSEPNRWFEFYDRNGSGQLDQEELVSALVTTFGGDPSSIRQVVAAVFPAFDRDGNGTIDRQEFCGAGGMGESLLAAMQQQQQGSSVQVHQQARAYVPSAYVPQAPTAPPESPQGVSTTTSDFWSCSQCTFINKKEEPTCKACRMPQPNYQALSASQTHRPAPYVPSVATPQPATYPNQYATTPPSPYVYQPPAATQVNHTQSPIPYQSQATQQPQVTTQQSNNMQTFRVLIPNGMNPGQRIQVDTGSTNAPRTVVAIPARSRWGQMPDGQSYFDVQLRKEEKPKPVPIQGSYVAAPSSRPSTSTSTTSYSQPAHTTSHSQTIHTQSHTSISHQPPGVSNPHFALISSQHITSTAKTLVLKERSMSYSGDDAQIKDTAGNIVFYVQAELMTMSQRRFMVDTRGQKIGQLRHKKTPGLHPTVYVGTVSDEKKCSVKMSGMLDPFNCDAKILLGDSNEIGKINGNWRAKKFSITIDGSVVAKVSKKRTMSSIFMGADTYCIDIQPGVDMAFVSLLVIALDELYNDSRGGGQGGGGIGGSFGPGW